MVGRRLVQHHSLVLTGFRGTGKSVVGRKVAVLVGLDFVDTDILLMEQLGCAISTYVQKFGWRGFRDQERQLLRVLAASAPDRVIATGGGAILHEQEWRTLRKKSLVVWLQADATTLAGRLAADHGSAATRPPLTSQGQEDEISSLLATRNPLYQRGSDLAISTVDRSPSKLAGEIAAWFEAKRT